MGIDNRLKALQSKHAAINAEILLLEARPRCCPTELKRLKAMKLRLKDETIRLQNPRRMTAPKSKKAKNPKIAAVSNTQTQTEETFSLAIIPPAFDLVA